MAASGQAVAMPAAAVSSVSASAAAGPMQAKDKPGKKGKKAAPAAAPALAQKAAAPAEEKTPLTDSVRDASDEELHSPEFQEQILAKYNEHMAALLKDKASMSKRDVANVAFRNNKADESRAYVALLKRLIEPKLQGIEDAAMQEDSPMGKMNATMRGYEQLIADDPAVSHLLVGAKAGLEGSPHYKTDQEQSEQIMNNFVLRAAAPHIGDRQAALARQEGDQSQAQADMKNYLRYVQMGVNHNQQGFTEVKSTFQGTVDLRGSEEAQSLLSYPLRQWKAGAEVDQAALSTEDFEKAYPIPPDEVDRAALSTEDFEKAYPIRRR